MVLLAAPDNCPIQGGLPSHRT
ncbi:hypothetical protein LINPERPRIM_LOCUS18686 [Linum perenne]